MSDIGIYLRGADRGTIGVTRSFKSFTLTQRRCDVGRWTLVTTSPEDAQILTTNAANARGIILRRDDDSGSPITIDSGWCEGLPTVASAAGRMEWTFSGWTDTTILADVDCWPKPSAALSAQTDAYHVITDTASNRIRSYAIANAVNRLAIPGFATGNALSLGPIATSQARFTNLLQLAQEIAGRDVNFAVRQRDSDRALFLYQWAPPDRRTHVRFTPWLGTVHGWEYSSTPAQATRVVVGAGGEQAARGFVLVVNTAEEATSGRRIERFVDRRDISLTDPDWQAKAQAGGQEFLAENGARASFKLNATDVSGMRYGVDFAVGDLVRAYIDQDTNGQPIGLVEDLIEEVTVTWSSEGERCEVRIGSTDDIEPTTTLARRLRTAMRRISDLEARR